MNEQMKLSLAAVITVLLLAAACSTESSNEEPVKTTSSTSATEKTEPSAKEAKKRDHALVRIFHVLPSQSNIDVWADSAKQFTNVAYKTVTPYQELSGEEHTFLVRVAGRETSVPLLQNREGLSDGKHYTVVALPGAAGGAQPTLRVINDNLTPPSAGKAKVRIIHASPDAGKVDVYVQGRSKPLFAAADFQSVSDYLEIDPKTIVFDVHSQDKDKPSLTTPQVKFEADKLYTIVITGWAKGTPGLEVVAIEDKLVG